MIKTFNYTDLKNKVTSRTVFVVQEPSDKLHCIDVSELDDEQIVEFYNNYKTLQKTFLDQVKALQKTFEVQHSYRTFLANRITDCVSEEL